MNGLSEIVKRKAILSSSLLFKVKQYPVKVGQDHSNTLDPNHTHFLLIDDAAHRKGITDNSINFIANVLDKHRSKTMLCQVAFDEKINTIKTLIRTIQYKLPCVLISVRREHTRVILTIH